MSSLIHLRRRRSLAGLGVLAVLASACGGGGGGDGGAVNGTTGTITARTPPVATTAAPPAQPQLQSIAVQPTDLPAAWKAQPASPPANGASDNAAFAQCVGVPSTLGDIAAIAYSPNYASGSSVISSTAASYKSPSDVQSDTSALTSPKASDCFVQAVKTQLTAALPKGATVKSVTMKITPGAGGGPANVVANASGTVVFAASGHQLTLKNEVVFLTAPRIEAQVAFFSTGNPVPAAVKAAVIQKVAARVANGS